MLVYASGRYINRSTATYFAEGDAGVQPVHKIVNVDSQLRIQRVQPLGQILFHRDQILLRGLERPVRPRFQKHRHIASAIPETSVDRTLSSRNISTFAPILHLSPSKRDKVRFATYSAKFIYKRAFERGFKVIHRLFANHSLLIRDNRSKREELI